MSQELWIIDHAEAIVEDGHVTLRVEPPTRHLPRKKAFEVADKNWFAGQMHKLEMARQTKRTETIPLTRPNGKSSLRMGGGFMITQGTKLVVLRRSADGLRPEQLCECGGLYEYVENNETGLENDFIASMLHESQEITLFRGNTMFIPRLAPLSYSFQDKSRKSLQDYHRVIQGEDIRVSLKAKYWPETNERFEPRHFWVKMLEFENSVRLEFGDSSPAIPVEIAAEIDTSSLECVGVLSYPENIDKAVLAYAEEKMKSAGAQDFRQRAIDAARETIELQEKTAIKLQEQIQEIIVLCKSAKEIKEILKKAKEILKLQEKVNSINDSKKHEIEYWDCEIGRVSPRRRRKPFDRDVLLIDIITGDVTVWYVPDRAKGKAGENRRKVRQSTIWEELSTMQLGPGPYGTSGRYANEKLERAIKMYCPHANLQPLITY